MVKNSRKIFVLGLDGVSWDQLNPLMKEGVLKNLKSICAKGVSGRMESIIPPETVPAWFAIATGLNPGKTGVFDYVNRTSRDSHAIVPLSPNCYSQRSIWDYLGKNGYEVGLFGYPTMSPPLEVQGFCVSGPDRSWEHPLAFPEGLEQELNDITGGYEDHINLRNPKYRKNIDTFFTDLNRIIKKQCNAIKYLAEKKNWDFFFAVFTFTDWMEHMLCKYYDTSHPDHDPPASREVLKKYHETWAIIDEFIGGLKSMLSEETLMMIISDHGSGPVASAFYANTWLERMGWLRKKRGWKQRVAGNLKLFDGKSHSRYGSRVFRILRNRILKIKNIMDMIDVESSLAISPDHNVMAGCLHLTQAGKKIPGFRDKLVQELRELPQKIDGIESVEIYLPEETYHGECVGLSPDIIFAINKYGCTVEVDFNDKPFSASPSLPWRSGGHAPMGIFIGSGDGVAPQTLERLHILDMAPTILAFYCVPVPANMDGNAHLSWVTPNQDRPCRSGSG